jgi:hypothetical protein
LRFFALYTVAGLGRENQSFLQYFEVDFLKNWVFGGKFGSGFAGNLCF